jgi:hypothetical protein
VPIWKRLPSKEVTLNIQYSDGVYFPGKESFSQAIRVLWLGHSLVSPKGWRCKFSTCHEAPKAAKFRTPPAMFVANRHFYTFFTVPMAQEWRLPLAFSAPVLSQAGLTWTAVVTIPHALILETLFSPNPQPLLPLSQVVQDESPSPLCFKHEWASFFSKFGKNSCRHQKVLV